MYEDLEPIVGLKYGQIIERVSQENGAKLSAALSNLAGRGLANSGMAISARLNSAVESCEEIGRGLYEAWLELILKRNQGKISRADVDFIMEKVKAFTTAQARNIAQTLSGSPDWAVERVRARTEAVASNIGRELEIKLREQEAFPKATAVAAAPVTTADPVNLPDPPNVGFIAFLRAFGESWLTQMSGPLTVPFALAALILPGFPKLLFAGLAIVCGVFSSYRVWRTARLSRAAR